MSERGDGDAGDRAAVDDEKPNWQRAVDPRLLAQQQRLLTDADRLRARLRPVRTLLRQPRLHVEPRDWGAGYLRAPREVEVPPQLEIDLMERLPQAQLRDLHRYEFEAEYFERPVWQFVDDRGGRKALAEARAARQPRTRPTVEPGVRAVRAVQAWRRELLAERWQPALPDDAPRRKVILASGDG